MFVYFSMGSNFVAQGKHPTVLELIIHIIKEDVLTNLADESFACIHKLIHTAWLGAVVANAKYSNLCIPSAGMASMVFVHSSLLGSRNTGYQFLTDFHSISIQ